MRQILRKNIRSIYQLIPAIILALCLLIYPAEAGDVVVEDLTIGPNPFKPGTQNLRIQYELSENASVSYTIYSISGQKVYENSYEAGASDYANSGRKIWDGTDLWGDRIANGVYFILLSITDGNVTHTFKDKIAVLR